LRTLVKGELRLSGFPELSPDGKYVAFSRDAPSDIWILDIEKNLTSRLTSDPAEDSFPVWSPDGRTIAFRSTRDGLGNIYTRAVGAVEEDKPLLKDEASKFPSDWSRDGKHLAYFTSAGDIWTLPVPGDSGERKPRRVTQTKFNETDAKFSPDGRWMAYVSNEPGQPEVYIQSFPEPGFKQQVSIAGGILPRWSHDGKELFYLEMPNLMAVPVKPAGSSLQIGAPASLFSPRVPLLDNVAADGRFLSFASMATTGTTTTTLSSPAHIVVIQNWAATAPKRK
jgi:Tol biopolymer transport system component